MITPSLFAEEHLTPIAVGDGWLTTFSSLDGMLYHAASLTDRAGWCTTTSLSQFANPLCIPGTPYLYDIEQVRDGVSVRQIPILADGLGQAKGWTSPAPDMEHYAVSAIVPDARGAVAMVCSPLTGPDQSLIIDATTGQLRGSAGPDQTPCGTLIDGTIIGEQADGSWFSRTTTGLSQTGAGNVVSMCTAFALVREATKTATRFSIVRPQRVERVAAPEGWTLLSAAASDRVLLAYAVHPTGRQRLIARDPNSATFRIVAGDRGAARVFSMGAATAPVARFRGLRAGSGWHSEGQWIAGVARPRRDIAVNRFTVEGLPCVVASCAGTRTPPDGGRLVVCLHGGPDSHELDDLRYGGAYRSMLDRGCRCLILNYPGSTAFGLELQTHAWQGWHESVQRVARAVQEIAGRHRCSEVEVIGASFGAWIGLQVAAHLDGVVRVVALSPILDLAGHIELRKRGDDAFAAWARARFGASATSAVAGDARSQACSAPVVVLAPVDDQVVLPAQTLRVVTDARAHGLPWVLEQMPGHHYPQNDADAAARWSKLASIVGD